MNNPLVVSLTAFFFASAFPFAAQDLSAQQLASSTIASIADADVTPPRVLYAPDPEYPPNARASDIKAPRSCRSSSARMGTLTTLP